MIYREMKLPRYPVECIIWNKISKPPQFCFVLTPKNGIFSEQCLTMQVNGNFNVLVMQPLQVYLCNLALNKKLYNNDMIQPTFQVF